jgi:hypothetical protein
VLARTEAESARKETSSARELAASQAEEDVAAAAEAWPRHPARCWRPPLGGGPFPRVTVRGQARFRRGWKQRRGCCSTPYRCLNLQEQFVCSMHMFFAATEA